VKILRHDANRPFDGLRISLLTQVGSQLFRLVVAIVVGGWTARYLGPSALGKLSYAAALVSVLGPIGSLGVKGSLAALLCEPKPLPGLVSTALCIELLGTGMLSLLLLPLAFLTSDPVITALLVFGVVANLFQSSEVFQVELLNRNRGSVVGRIGFLQVLAGTSFTISALIFQAPLVVFGAVQSLQSAFSATLLAVAVKFGSFRQLMVDIRWSTAKPLLRRGLPLLLASLSIMLYMKSDLVMLEWLSDSADVGQYSAAVRVAESIYFLPMILVQTYMPRIGVAADRSAADRSLRELYRFSWLLGMSMMLLLMFVLPFMIPVVFGRLYVPAQGALFYLGPAAFAVATGSASNAWLTIKGYEALVAQRSAFGALVNVVLNLFLVPARGIEGAAIATSISYILSVYPLSLIKRETRSNTLLLLWPL